MRPTAISLFSGIGGLDLAFSRAGFDVVAQVEVDEFCQKVLRKHASEHWPNAKVYSDVREVGKHNLPPADVIFGGFPCQDISTAGKGAGIKEGTRSGLWFEFARIIGELRPKFVLLENVSAIVARDGQTVLNSLAALGYDAEWGVIPASATGAPHRRDRWFCVAYPNGTGYENPRDGRASMGATLVNGGNATNNASKTPDANSQDLAHTDGTRESQSQGYDGSIGRRIEYSGETMGDSTGAALQRGIIGQAELNRPAKHGDGSTQRILGRAVDGLSRRMDGHRWPARPGEDQYWWEAPRVATQKQRSRAARLKVLGNAVVPQVVQPIAEAIYASLKETFVETSNANIRS